MNTAVMHCNNIIVMQVHVCYFIWNGNVSQTLQKILTFYVPLHYPEPNIHKKGLINLTIQAVVQGDYI